MNYTVIPGGMCLLPKCRVCERIVELYVTDKEWATYQKGAHVQNSFPNMSADGREMLISQTCDICWSSLFGDEDDWEDEDWEDE